jgi:hypothetical protein
MRRATIVTVLLTLGVATVACSGHKDEAGATNNTVAPGGFVPPTALNRTDFVDMLDKRFTQLDLNHDSILQASEIPARHHDRILSFDANHNGEITLDEFEKGGLARFDEADRNKDQVLTGDERRAALGSEMDDSAANVTAPANSE